MNIYSFAMAILSILILSILSLIIRTNEAMREE